MPVLLMTTMKTNAQPGLECLVVLAGPTDAPAAGAVAEAEAGREPRKRHQMSPASHLAILVTPRHPMRGEITMLADLQLQVVVVKERSPLGLASLLTPSVQGSPVKRTKQATRAVADTSKPQVRKHLNHQKCLQKPCLPLKTLSHANLIQTSPSRLTWKLCLAQFPLHPALEGMRQRQTLR